MRVNVYAEERADNPEDADPRTKPTPTPHIGHARWQQMACVSGSSLGLTQAASESVVLHGLRG